MSTSVVDTITNNVLFLTQKIGKDATDHAYCGVGIRGKLTSDILKQETPGARYRFIPCFVDSQREVELKILEHQPKIIIYNFHGTTTKWVYDSSLIFLYPQIVHIMIHYDMNQWYVDHFRPEIFCHFNYIMTDDDTLIPNQHILVMPRSLPCDGLFINHVTSDTEISSVEIETGSRPPKIGFQGFGFPHKGIDRLAQKVQEEFDEAIIRLHMPCSYYGDPAGEEAQKRIKEVKQILKKPGIQLEVSTQFMDDETIVRWLHDNDLNCYFYHYQDGCGIASSPDYAIAAHKPIAITHSFQLRHMWNLKPSIQIEENSLKTIMANGVAPLEPLYAKHSHTALRTRVEQVCDQVIV